MWCDKINDDAHSSDYAKCLATYWQGGTLQVPVGPCRYVVFYSAMAKYVKLLLKNGEENWFEVYGLKRDYPIMCSDAENALAAELDFHKMRILAERYSPVYNDNQKIVSMKVSRNNITVYLLNDPAPEECVNLIDIWSGFMQMGYCKVLKSNIFK